MRTMLTPQELAERLRRDNIPDVQRATGIAYNTLKKLRDQSGDCYYDTIKRVSDYYMDKEAKKPD